RLPVRQKHAAAASNAIWIRFMALSCGLDSIRTVADYTFNSVDLTSPVFWELGRERRRCSSLVGERHTGLVARRAHRRIGHSSRAAAQPQEPGLDYQSGRDQDHQAGIRLPEHGWRQKREQDAQATTKQS